jgi:hypothetical protein
MYKLFNRHDLFDGALMKFHSQTIRNVEDFSYENGKGFHNSLTNMLCGIWDGYLYNNLLSEAQEMNLPYEDLVRIETTIKLIEEYIAKNGQTVTQI